MRFQEAEVKAVGGLSVGDRSLPHIDEMMSLAIEAVPKFTESVIGGGGIAHWWESAKSACRSLREANSETTLGFLMRKGLQSAAQNWYNLSERQWQNYAQTETSTGVAEWYAPLYHTTIPGPVERGGRFPESRIQGEDDHIRNIVFGQVIAVDRTLFDDDQTGQIRQYSAKLGDSMGVLESVWLSSRFIGAARTYANVTVPASTYTTTDINGTSVTTPFSSTLYGTGTGNRAQTYGPLNVGRLARAYVQGLNAVDPLQNKIICKPNTLLVSSMDALNGKTILAPGGWPGLIGPSDTAVGGEANLGSSTTFDVGTPAGDTGVPSGYPGGFSSPNPFGGLGWKLVVERYFPDWAWALGEKGKGFIMQERDPLEVVQEAINGGSYFDFDSIRYRSRRRFNADWVGGGSRFWFLGNDGSVTGTL